MGRPTKMLNPGDRQGRLTVLRYAGSMIASRAAAFLVRCDCGSEFVTRGSSFRRGDTKSCGCLVRLAMGSVTHGKSKSSGTYKTWTEMRARCSNPNNRRYPRYGGRGISMCARWLESFECFLADMGEKPSSAHSIDRIDNDGNYEPGNCRWATASEQARNKSTTKLSESLVQEIKGRYEHGEGQYSIADRLGVWQCTVSSVLRGATWSGVGEPVAKRKRRMAKDASDAYRRAS